jgi:hypothetical protein
MAVQTVQSLRSVQAVQADQCLARTKFKYPLPCGCQIDFGFSIPTESPLKSKNHLAMCALMPSSLLTFSTKAKLPTAITPDHRASQVNIHQTAMQVLIAIQLLIVLNGEKRFNGLND